MRVFINEGRVKRMRQLATAMFFVSLVILIGGLILGNTVSATNYAVALLPLLALPVGLVTTWISVRLTNQYVREPHPEDALGGGLKGASRQGALYHYLFKANHVLVCPQGVFAIVTRFQDGPIQVRGEKVINLKTRGLFGSLLSLMRQDQIGQPVREALTAAADLQPHIDAALPGTAIRVQPVIVFISSKVELDVEDPAVPVVLTNPKKKPTLKSLLRDGKKGAPAISTPDLTKLIAALNAELSIGDAQSRVIAEDEA